jgi:uncharacterized protein
MAWAALPETAAWTHREARSGFEVAWFAKTDGGAQLTGCTTAIEDGWTWAVDYEIRVDDSWCTRRARVRGRSASGERTVVLTTDGHGHWRVDGEPAPQLDGCLDIDLESSAMTNALPVHRFALRPGDRADSPAAYVRASDLTVQRLEQEYVRVDASGFSYDYTSRAFDFSCRLVYDDAGLALEYPGIAVRFA